LQHFLQMDKALIRNLIGNTSLTKAHLCRYFTCSLGWQRPFLVGRALISENNNKSKSEAPIQPTSTWFDQMTGYLDWEVVGPNLHDPFKVRMPVYLLRRMADDREFLCEYVHVRCLCDGYEVMVIENPSKPHFNSDHPCISKTAAKDIVGYLQKNAVDVYIWQQIEKIQEEIKQHVGIREKESPDGDEEPTSILQRVDKQQKESSTSAKNQQFRLIKR